ncbi:MAG: hypothetical protein Q9221_001068 [Calogaya cf. arnoldii]
MGKFSEKCKKIFQGKKSAPTEDADRTQLPKPNRARDVLRNFKRTEVHPSTEEPCVTAAQEASHPPELTVILSPPSAVDSPATLNGDSQVRCASSCYSTPTPKGRFHHTPETAQSPESVYLRTPHDRTSYVKLLDDSFRCSNTAGTPDRSSTACAPLVTTTDPFGISERSVGSGPEGPDACGSLAQVLAEHAEPKEEAAPSVEGTAKSEAAEQPAQEIPSKDNKPADDNASIKSDTASAWERAMESREQSFQIEIQDLKEDHAAEVSELKKTIAKLEKDAENAKKRKTHVEKVANKKIADISTQKDEVEVLYSGLQDASELEYTDSLRERDEQLQERDEELEYRDSLIKRYHDFAVTTAAWNTDIKHELSEEKLVVRSLQQEVARLDSSNLDNAQKISHQCSQITFLRDTHASIQNSQPQLMTQLAQACKERDCFEADSQHFTDLYETTLRDLLAAQREINHMKERLKTFMCHHEDQPHATEAAGLLTKTREAHQALEKKANECLFRERKAREGHEKDKKSWGIDRERKQKTIDNLAAKIVLLEKFNARLVDDLEKRIGFAHGRGEVDDRRSFLYQQSRNTVDELQSHISQQESHIAAQEQEIHQQKVNIDLLAGVLSEKDDEVCNLAEEKINAERQIEEIQTKSDEREIVSATELEKATNDVDWYYVQNQDLELQIHNMIEQGVSKTLNEIHHAEMQEQQQYIAALENDIRAFRRQQEDQTTKEWHDAHAAVYSDRAEQILRMNWENANEQVRQLTLELETFRQGSHPQIFEAAEQIAGLREEQHELQRRLEKSDEEKENVVADLETLRLITGSIFDSLKLTWSLHGEIDLLRKLGPVADEINEIMGKYPQENEDGVEELGDVRESQEEVEVEPELEDYMDDEAEPELPDYVDDEEQGLDQPAEGNKTAAPVQGANIFQIPTSAFRESWANAVTNPFRSAPDHDRAEGNHGTPAQSSYRPGHTFAAEDYTHLFEPVPNAETNHAIWDPLNNSNHIDLEDYDEDPLPSTSPNPTPQSTALTFYQPPIEAVDEEFITRGAYNLKNNIQRPQEWGHETYFNTPYGMSYEHYMQLYGQNEVGGEGVGNNGQEGGSNVGSHGSDEQEVGSDEVDEFLDMLDELMNGDGDGDEDGDEDEGSQGGIYGSWS